MPAPKKTITRDSVFRRAPAAAERPVQGITQGIPENDAPNRQTAIWLSDDEIEWLDDHIQQIKRGGWRSATRSALVRALIQARMQDDIDLAGATGQAELTQRLSSKE